MHIAATSPLCSVVKKRSLGKRICVKNSTLRTHCIPQPVILTTEMCLPEVVRTNRLLNLSSSYLEFHQRFLLLKPNGNSGSILKEICCLQQVFLSAKTDITWPSFAKVYSFLDIIKKTNNIS